MDLGEDEKMVLAFFLIITLFVILSFSIINSVGASSTMWTETYGGTSNEYAFSLVETSDGGYIIGGYTEPMFGGSSDCWLVKTDANGNMLWNKTYGGESYDYLSSLVETSDGGYALACTTQSFGVGNNDFWLVKTDMNGNMEWNKTYGGAESDITYSLIESSDGGYAIAGLITDILWLVKTDVNGNMLWNQTYGRAAYSSWTSLAQTFNGGYAIAGTTDEFDFWLIKTDANGNMLWNHTYGGTEMDGAYSLVETYDGGFALAGTTTSYGHGLNNFWLVRTDEYGIPEFPSGIILPLFIAATVFVTIFKKRLFIKRS